MASPIPTQLSPGVNVSEIDLSTFVQPVAQNVGGMAGVFNWGPCGIATPISSESELAAVYGKPTLDQSDTTSNVDFLAASNFLRYSNSLKVVRVLQSEDYNSVSMDLGVTSRSNIDHPTIHNFDEFRALGGFDDAYGIESVSYFKARYPGNFGDSLKVIAYDGGTSDYGGGNGGGGGASGGGGGGGNPNTVVDYKLWGGYDSIVGVSSGVAGFTLTAWGATSAEGNIVQLGATGATFEWVMVTFSTPNNETGAAFTEQIRNGNERFDLYYGRGTTTANWTSTIFGSNPDGNSDLYKLKFSYNPELAFNPFFELSKTYFLINPSLTNANAVDFLFPSMDQTHKITAWNRGNTYNFGGSIGVNEITYSVVEDGSQVNLPASFSQQTSGGVRNSILFAGSIPATQGLNPSPGNPNAKSPWENLVDLSRGVPLAWEMHGPVSTPSSAKGFARLIGLTGNHGFKEIAANNTTVLNEFIAFDTSATTLKQAVINNFKYGTVQLGRFVGTNFLPKSTSSGNNNNSGSAIFDKVPGTSEYAANVGGSNDELSFAVVDAGGKFGPKGAILEKFELLSKAVDAKNLDGESIFYKDYINTNSQYIYLTKAFGFSGGGNAESLATTDFGDMITQKVGADGITYTNLRYYESVLALGESTVDAATSAEKIDAYSVFADDKSAVDILFVSESSVADDSDGGKTDVEQGIYDAVIEPRKDTIFVIPTPKPTSATQHTATTTTNTINFRNSNLSVPSNSYTMLVAGRKVFFDTYNNQTRKMSLASDVAGILSAQEIAWESPAGFLRGNLRNVIKMETAFSKTDRDELYKNQINFFTEFNDGSGTVLFGDKTLLVKPSAFDRINVRRVFIAAEKAIAKAAKYSLFEFNDEFTRSQFRNLVNPFLANLVAQRGIADYKVVCDATNNTAQVIDNNQFVADIFIKPLKSINFVQLNFIATRSDINLTTTE